MRTAVKVILFICAIIGVACNDDNKTPEPVVPEGILFEAKYSSGAYYGDEYSAGADNYFITLSDNGYDERGYIKPNSTYYRMDLYTPIYTGEWSEWMSLPEGEYIYDPEDTYAAWTFSADYSEYVVTNDTEITTKLEFESGKLIVGSDSTTLTVVIAGETHTVTFSGEHVIANISTKPADDSNLTVEHAYAVYYGKTTAPNGGDNFYLYLSDKGLDAQGFEQAGGTYYALDLYTETVADEEALAIPFGTYEWDAQDSYAPWTVSAYYTKYYVWNSDGTDYLDARYPTAATVTVTEEGVKAEVCFDEATHTIEYKGEVKIYKKS